jgi:hypothetical protein
MSSDTFRYRRLPSAATGSSRVRSAAVGTASSSSSRIRSARRRAGRGSGPAARCRAATRAPAAPGSRAARRQLGIDLPQGGADVVAEVQLVADGDEPEPGVPGLQVVGEHVAGVPAEPGPPARVQVVPGDGEPLQATAARPGRPPAGARGRAIATARLTTALRNSAANPAALPGSRPAAGRPGRRRRRRRTRPGGTRAPGPGRRCRQQPLADQRAAQPPPDVSAASGSAAGTVDQLAARARRGRPRCGRRRRRVAGLPGCASCVPPSGCRRWPRGRRAGRRPAASRWSP